MDNGVVRGGDAAGKRGRPLAMDSLGAVLAAESALADRIATTFALEGARQPAVHAFGDALVFEHGPDAVALAKKLGERAGEGERVTLIASPDAFAAARGELELIARRRLPLVFHALCDHGFGGAFALADLGWAVLFASGVQDSIDLALVARRAAEDSGTPFFVVHERSIVRHLEPVASPLGALCDAFLGARAARVPKITDAAHPRHARMSERAFSERVPFALGSAMRGLEAFTGRKHDVIEKSAGDSAALMLVGAGSLGDALLGEAARLRAAGHDVGAVKVTALRPFPGPRLIRALARAHVVTVLEVVDEPLAQSNPLTREVKAAFADALTWAPDYPGIGRLPRIHSGVVGSGDHALESGDIDAVVRNMVEGEQGKRLFVLGSDAGLTLAREAVPAPYASWATGGSGRLAMSGRVADASTANACAELAATVIPSVLALQCRVSVGAPRGSGSVEGEGATFDLVAGRDRPRGVAVPHAVDLVALDDPGALLEGNPLARVTSGSLVAVPTTQTDAEGLWGELPVYVKAIAFDRGVRVLGFHAPLRASEGEGEERRWMVAAAFVGVALFALGEGRGGARPAIDGSLVERDVTDALSALHVESSLAAKAGRLARQTFESPLEVPRATVERDLPAVQLGRRDARAGAP
jgi:hypothetical protein